ncbi:ABC transporter ATP-binding protein [Pseudooceanicola algae]|uniref:Vitamin B12 import ATP-binding protein BtuD n=1 Tax=Pseudooceanicola algae TaxID=1537215 RepID=A0A418SFE0_9RHOB|nr:ABC transporter ATP-binding protein [Pseudooceanicola algae]QPM89200.1 Vitamin B12 import ATP-binding protein BtuD [Pseudooceanicola algae]
MSVDLSETAKLFAGKPAVDGITTRIEAGEFFVVLGPSGCGKSTLLRLIAGLEPLDRGTISLGGTAVSAPGLHVPPEERDVAVVFQTYALWPHMSVRDNVAFPLECDGLGRQAARTGADQHLRTVSLTEHADRKPADLSGGQRQRVALARCLASGSGLVLMDEPLANLDPHLRNRMEEELLAFHKASGATVIYITHDQREAMALADRIAVMEAGRFVQVGAPEDIHDRPETAHVARFIGRAALLEARLDGATADLGPIRVALSGGPRKGPGQVVLRPRDLDLGSGNIPACAEQVFYRGGGWEGALRVQGLAEALPFRSDARVTDGETLQIAIKQAWALPA